MKILATCTHAALAAGGLMLAFAASAHEDKMQTMDTNKDGMISATEHADGARQMFAKMDADADGRVTVAEMDTAHAATGEKPHTPAMSSADKIRAIDANGDGAITAAEHEAGSRSMFGKMDANRDGNLTSAELEAGHQKLMEAQPR
jgi:Ca2+-binding EF-hand superfamily protein